MTGIIRTILDNQRKVTLYEFALREIVCIVCEQGHSVIPVLGDNIADRALQEVQRMVKRMSSLQKARSRLTRVATPAQMDSHSFIFSSFSY